MIEISWYIFSGTAIDKNFKSVNTKHPRDPRKSFIINRKVVWNNHACPLIQAGNQ